MHEVQPSAGRVFRQTPDDDMNAHIWQQPTLCAQSAKRFDSRMFSNRRLYCWEHCARAAGLLPTMAGLPWAANRGRYLPATPPHTQGYLVWPQKQKRREVGCRSWARGTSACQFISRRPPTPCLPGAPRYCFLAQENRARAPSQSSSRSSRRRGSQRGRSRFIEEVRRL